MHGQIRIQTTVETCEWCKGSGIEVIEGHEINCWECQGQGARTVILPKEVQEENPNEELRRI